MATQHLSRLTSNDLSATDAALLRDRLERASTVSVGDVTIEVSDHARAVLSSIFSELAAGRCVGVMPLSEMLTTQQAADVLRVSRPTLVKMLNDGLLPYEQPGVHRRVPRAAVEEFLGSRRERRRAALDALRHTHDPDGPDEIVATR